MSKSLKWFSALFFLLSALSGVSAQDSTQPVELTIKVDPDNRALTVSADISKSQMLPEMRAFSIQSSYSRSVNSIRVKDFQAFDENGKEIAARELQPGEFLIRGKASSIGYSVDLAEPADISKKAHASWIGDAVGVLMLRDLFPDLKSPVPANVKLLLPAKWSVSTSAKKAPQGFYRVEDLDNSIFLIGNSIRSQTSTADDRKISITISGDFLFDEADVLEFSGSILRSYRSLFGSRSDNSEIEIAIVKVSNAAGRWEAETRGNTVLIVSGDMQFEKPSRQRLHEQLRHELLHLWIPNDLALSGDYAWFYEGFTVYQALKIGLAENRISFDDFLRTIADAVDLTSDMQREPFVGASKRRFSGAKVYAESLLIAFLCDAVLMEKTRGKRSVADLLAAFYRQHKRGANSSEDGNTAAVKLLTSEPELKAISDSYVTGSRQIDLRPALTVFGLVQVRRTGNTEFLLKAKPTKRQKDLLDKLGYNNWRKVRKDRK
ncbi:MAG: hypothetical protein KIS76_19545 [Pyrinomonadaceae bacterium]|nr:hypothetical protein [Pyrinomonadaceae bacterium]